MGKFYEDTDSKTILVIRLSAMGDVAMTVPVLHSLLKEYPEYNVVMVTTYGYDPMFDNLPGVHIVHFDKHGQNKGIIGIFKIWRKIIHTYNIDMVADLHNVIRSRLLTMLLRFSTKAPIVHIDKEHSEKRKLCKLGYEKYGKTLKSSFERYNEVFRKLGLKFKTEFTTIFKKGVPDIAPEMKEYFGEKNGTPWIGIAPFAGHRSKIYPMDKMSEVVDILSNKGYKVMLFGHGQGERKVMNKWAKKYQNVYAMPPETYLPQELILMAHLDVMVSMDSANMHLASMVNVPVVSVWGATHPAAGFMGWDQKEENAVQLPLDCRPCSTYGDLHCPKGTYECVRNITPSMIVDKVEKVLGEVEIKQN